MDRGLDAMLPHVKVDIVEQRGLMLTVEHMVGLVRRPLNRTRDAKVELAHSGLLCGLLLAGLGFLRSHHLMSDESRQGRHALGLEHAVAALLLDLCDQVLAYGLVSIRNRTLARLTTNDYMLISMELDFRVCVVLLSMVAVGHLQDGLPCFGKLGRAVDS